MKWFVDKSNPIILILLRVGNTHKNLLNQVLQPFQAYILEINVIFQAKINWHEW